jgi:hypothetical protein
LIVIQSLGGGIVILSALCGWALSAAMLAAQGADGQPSGPYPRLPGEETAPPELAARHAPFDIKAYFQAPPRSENAAYPYLDALFEFGPEMESCFAPGPRRDRRKAEAEDRVRRFMAVWDAFAKDEKVAPAAMDAAVKDFEAGYRKLEQAQRLPKCVFLPGTGPDGLLPYAQVARTVARASQVRARRMLDRGEVDAAIGELRLVLRLARDLRPRGTLICQLVSDAIESSVIEQITRPILASPKLSAARCDQLIRTLYDHERNILDGWGEGLKAEFVRNERIIVEGMPDEPSVKKALEANPPSLTEISRAAKQVADAYAILLKAGATYRQRAGAFEEAMKQFARDTLVAKLALMAFPDADQSAQAWSRCRANARGTLALAAIRRWQFDHPGQAPKSLAEACKAAKVLPPLDPYDGKPLRYVVREGKPVVYAIGKDLKDDGGAVDSKKETEAGDIVLQLTLSK